MFRPSPSFRRFVPWSLLKKFLRLVFVSTYKVLRDPVLVLVVPILDPGSDPGNVTYESGREDDRQDGVLNTYVTFSVVSD